jgi:hypothetical protein
VPVYRVQRRAAFGVGDWADLPGPVGGTDALVLFLDSTATNAQNFYRVQRRAAFGTGDWADLPGPVGGTDALVLFLDSTATNAQNFYRVRVGP